MSDTTLFLVSYWRTSSLLSSFGNYEKSCCKHLWADFCLEIAFSILFIFKKQLLKSFIFSIVFLVSFIYFLIFVIYFLLNLGLFSSSFSSSLRVKIRLLFKTVFFFLIYAYISINLPLRTAFSASHTSWYVVFLFFIKIIYF